MFTSWIASPGPDFLGGGVESQISRFSYWPIFFSQSALLSEAPERRIRTARASRNVPKSSISSETPALPEDIRPIVAVIAIQDRGSGILSVASQKCCK